jgi:hypothetical protein
VLADQADLSGAAALPIKNEKGRYVYDALWNKSQANPRTDPAMDARTRARASILLHR